MLSINGLGTTSRCVGDICAVREVTLTSITQHPISKMCQSKPQNYFSTHRMKTYQCLTCGFIYSEADGYPIDGIAAGTLWEDVPEDWVCPDCGTLKSDFVMVEI